MYMTELFQIKYNEQLNPVLWQGTHLKPEVQTQLMEICDAFIDYIDVKHLPIDDIILTGSNANYNWTSDSDIDLHIVVNMDEFRSKCPEMVDDFFNNKKTLWNEHHEIDIYGHLVEVYVQDSREAHVSTGQYSLSQQAWTIHPIYKPPKINDSAVITKSQQLKYEISELINAHANEDTVNKMKTHIKKLRQSGLSRGGEFSTENLAFKELRNSGYLDKLYKYGRFLTNKHYSLDRDLLPKGTA